MAFENIIKNVNIIGLLGFLLAAYTFYKTQIRKARIEIVAGPTITIYYSTDGGTGFYLPIVFTNENDQAGKVSSVDLQILVPKTGIYTIRWGDFAVYDSDKRRYSHIDHARPFSVSGHSVIDKLIWFIWRPYSQPKLNFVEGCYKINVEVYFSNKPKKSKKFSYEFLLTQVDVNFLNIEKAKNTSITRKITLRSFESENTFSET